MSSFWDTMTVSALKESYPNTSNEALDMFLRDVTRELEHHSINRSQFGVDMNYPQALLDDKNFAAIAYLKEYYDNGYGQGQQQGMIDDMRENLSVHYEEDERRVIPAANLPAGWTWQQYNDGSGGLYSPDDKSVVSYDLSTSEYKYKGNWNFMAGYPSDTESFADFKDSMEKRVSIDRGIDVAALSAEKAVPNLHTSPLEAAPPPASIPTNNEIKKAEKDLKTMEQLPALYDEAIKDYITEFKNANPAFKDVQIPYFHPPMPDYLEATHNGNDILAERIDNQTVQATQFCLMKDDTDAKSPYFVMAYRIDKIDDTASYNVQNLSTRNLAEARHMFDDVVAGRPPKGLSIKEKLDAAIAKVASQERRPEMSVKRHAI